MLLDSDALELSGVVANSAMNRERVCVGKNSYAREISFDPLDFLTPRLENQGQAAWLDLCCGRGRALIEAAERLAPYSFNSNLKLLGVDLVGMFDSFSPTLSFIFSPRWILHPKPLSLDGEEIETVCELEGLAPSMRIR